MAILKHTSENKLKTQTLKNDIKAETIKHLILLKWILKGVD